ncbi:type VII secretion target [Nocardia sp. NPDC004415]
MTTFDIDTDEVRRHATAIDAYGDEIEKAADAARYLTMSTDGYGVYGQPVALMLQGLQGVEAGALTALGVSLHSAGDKLRFAAGVIDQVDAGFGKSIDTLRDEITDFLDGISGGQK